MSDEESVFKGIGSKLLSAIGLDDEDEEEERPAATAIRPGAGVAVGPSSPAAPAVAVPQEQEDYMQAFLATLKGERPSPFFLYLVTKEGLREFIPEVGALFKAAAKSLEKTNNLGVGAVLTSHAEAMRQLDTLAAEQLTKLEAQETTEVGGLRKEYEATRGAIAELEKKMTELRGRSNELQTQIASRSEKILSKKASLQAAAASVKASLGGVGQKIQQFCVEAK